MKKIIAVGLVCFSLVQISIAQVSINVGGFGGYGTNYEQVSIGGIAEIMLNHRFSLSTDFAYYSPKQIFPYYKYSEINENINFYFIRDARLQLYCLAGINLGLEEYQYSDRRNLKLWNFNHGLGFNYLLTKRIIPFAQVKYILAYQATVVGGMKFKLFQSKKGIN